MRLKGKHPIHGLPFDAGEVASRMDEEFRALPRGKRWQLMRKVVQREALMLATGQAWLCRDRAPREVLKLLWIYNWTTLGDSIMDLTARFSLPEHVQADLCITPALAQLYLHDTRFRHVYASIEDCAQDYDFVLLHALTGKALRGMRQHVSGTPFAPMIGYVNGEQFARLPFADARLRYLFRLPAAAPPAPALGLGPRQRPAGDRFEIAVGLGARDARRSYPHWGDALRGVLARWPAELAPPLFRLLGVANASGERTAIGATFIANHCVDHVDRLSLIETARTIRDSDAFLGTDGGLMHVAAATRVPGLALFTVIDPRMRLAEDSSIQFLTTDRAMADFAPAEVAKAFVDALRPEADRLAQTRRTVTPSTP